jgi:ribosomal protein L32
MSDDVKPWDMLNPNQPRSGEELAAYRLEICKTCEFFRQKAKTCMKCGCFMKMKTTLKNAHCPIGKW